MASNNENLRNNNDQPPPPDHDADGDVLAPRTNLPSINTDQPYKPATASAGGSVQADSGYRTGSTSGTTPAFPTPSSLEPTTPAPVSAVEPTTPAPVSAVSTTSTPASTSTSGPASFPSAATPRGHARKDAQDMGKPVTAKKPSTKLGSIDENEPTSSTAGRGRNAQDDSVFDAINMTKSISFTPVDTTSLRLGPQQHAATDERHGTSPISPKTLTHPLKSHPIQPQGGQILEGPGPHIPKHREHKDSETSGILRSQKSLAKLDTTMDTASPKRPTFDDAAINKPRSNKEYPTTPYEKEKEGAKLKMKQKPLKVGMGQPIKQLAVKLRGKITGVDERAREAQSKARQASADAQALHEEVTGKPTGMSKMLQKVQIPLSGIANTREASKSAIDKARRTRSQWWPDWRKSQQKKVQQAPQAKKPYVGVDYDHEKKRPVRFAGHSSDSSTASNWARGTVSKVEDIASRTLMKASGRKVKSEADALDNTTGGRLSSWRGRGRLVDAKTPLNTLPEVTSFESAASAEDNSHLNGAAMPERPRQPSGIHEIPPDEAEQDIGITRFPSMPSEASATYEQSVHTCHSAQEPNSDNSQPPSVSVHDPIIAGDAVQPMIEISQAPSVLLQDPAPQQTANALTVPNSPPVRPSSTATDNVP